MNARSLRCPNRLVPHANGAQRRDRGNGKQQRRNDRCAREPRQDGGPDQAQRREKQFAIRLAQAEEYRATSGH